MRMDDDKVTIETTIINYSDMLNQVQLVAELKKENLALLQELANADNILYDIAKNRIEKAHDDKGLFDGK